MANWKKLAQGAAGAGGGEALNVEDVFSTYLYTGNSSTQTITNGIDLDGEGGLVWTKGRTSVATSNHSLFDTERGVHKWLRSNLTGAELTYTNTLTAFNSNGFTLGNNNQLNYTGEDYASWTFRKAPKFFDVVTYTGNGTAGRTVSHNLGSVPGCIFVKALSSGQSWAVYHRGVASDAETDYLLLNDTNAAVDNALFWNDTAPTASNFTVGTRNEVNGNGITYVAYLFAHNDGDGEFGPDGDADIIKCGSYTGNGSTDGPEIDLGFEPQWLLVKRASGSGNWQLWDSMRGWCVGADSEILEPNTSDSENNEDILWPQSSGFKINYSLVQVNGSGETYIYMAIRRGPMAVPESATDVFKVDQGDGSTTNPQFVSNFVTDFGFFRNTGSGNNWETSSRLQGSRYMRTNLTSVEAADGDIDWDFMTGFYGPVRNTSFYAWMWKRAPNFFDVITWKVDGTGDQTINHNLGVVPEMIWTKNRDDSGSGSGDWWIAHKDMTGWDSASQNDRHAFQGFAYNASAQQGYHRDFSSTSIRLLSNAAGGYGTGDDCIGFLFASLDGVSKVGSFTGNGSSQTIDCGFSNGARFILIKRTDSGSSWTIYDTVRGIVSGVDGYLALNSTSAQITYDDIDPNSSGFIVNGPSVSGASGQVNVSSASYIFYAVA